VIELPLVIAEQVLSGRVADAVGVVLVQVLALREGGDGLPVRDLERPPGRAGVGQRLRDTAAARQWVRGGFDEGTDAIGQLAGRLQRIWRDVIGYAGIGRVALAPARATRWVGRQVAERRVRQDFSGAGVGIAERGQRTVPVDRVPADAHGRELKAVAE